MLEGSVSGALLTRRIRTQNYSGYFTCTADLGRYNGESYLALDQHPFAWSQSAPEELLQGL